MLVVVATGLVAAACSDGAVDDADAVPASTSPPVTTTSVAPATTSVVSEDVAAPVTTSGPAVAEPRPMTVDWVDDRQRDGTVEVPLDHADPSAGATPVRVRRAPARNPDERIGVLMVNAGGPGTTGFALVDRVQRVFTPTVRDRFDIVAVAPRGTEATSGVVSCLPMDERAEFETSLDWSPDEPGEAEALDAHVAAAMQRCADDNVDLVEHVSTMDTVHDMAIVVDALGEDQVSFLGTSYGAPVGAAFASEHPELTRAAVLDAANHPTVDPTSFATASVSGEEALLARLYSDCDSNPDCPIAGDTQAAFERVARAADAQPLQSDPNLPPINENALAMTIFSHPDVYAGNPDVRLLEAIADADDGDSSGLQRRFRDMIRFQSSLPAFHSILCSDWPWRDTDLSVDVEAELRRDAPLLSSTFSGAPLQHRSSKMAVCGAWPVAAEPLPSPLSAAGAGPVLLLSATGDVATPPASAQQLRDELVDAALVYVESNRHGSYNVSSAPEHRCATELVEQLLVDLDLPSDGTVCATAPENG